MASNVPVGLRESVANTKCEYRQLGSSGLRVSVPIFGCMSIGDNKALSWAVGEDEVRFSFMMGPVLCRLATSVSLLGSAGPLVNFMFAPATIRHLAGRPVTRHPALPHYTIKLIPLVLWRP
jgi:hypothetical protein